MNLLLLGGALVGDRRHQRNHVVGCLAVALSIWNLGVFGLRSTDNGTTAMVWEQVVHLGVAPIPVLFYHYVLAFLDLPRRRPSLLLGYALGVLFLTVSPTPLFMSGVVETHWGFTPKSGPLYGPFFLYVQAYLLLGLFHLVRSYRTTVSSFRRNRTRLVIFGVAVSPVGGAVDFLRFMFGWERLYPIGIPTNAVFAMALGVAIVRYRLWDVGILAKRLVLYVLTSLGLAPLLVGALYLLDRLTPGDDFTPNLPVALALLAVVTVALPFLRRTEAWFERLMFARQHGVRDAFVGLSKDIAAVMDLRRLGETLTQGLVDRIPVMHAALYLQDHGAKDRFISCSETASPALDTEAARPSLDDRLVLWLRLRGKVLAVEEIAHQSVENETMEALVATLEASPRARRRTYRRWVRTL